MDMEDDKLSQLFKPCIMIKNIAIKIIVVPGSYINLFFITLIKILVLHFTPYPKPYTFM